MCILFFEYSKFQNCFSQFENLNLQCYQVKYETRLYFLCINMYIVNFISYLLSFHFKMVTDDARLYYIVNII